MIRRRPELDTEHLPGQIVNKPEYTIGDYVKNIEENIAKEEKSFGVGGSLVPKDVWEQIGASLGDGFDPKR